MSSTKPLHYPWSKIHSYHTIASDLEHPREFKAKIKLHGTNAGISVTTVDDKIVIVPQGRNQAMTHQTFGGQFYNLVAKHNEALIKIRGRLGRDFVIYGELCGQKIQPAVACSKLPVHHFFVFAVKLIYGDDEKNVHEYEPDTITQMLEPILSDPQIRVLPWETDLQGKQIVITLGPENHTDLNLVNELTDAADKQDPYIERTFNIIGHGEGYVWYSTTGGLKFKSKGEAHRNIKTNKPAVEKLPNTNGLTEYLDLYMTEQRYAQGLKDSGCDSTMTTTRLFVNWVSKDTFDESDDKKFEFGSHFAKAVNARASEWYRKHVLGLKATSSLE